MILFLLLSPLMLATVNSSHMSQGLYKKMWVLESDWNDGGALYRTVPPESVMSLAACAGLCHADDECDSCHFSADSGCQLGKQDTVNLWASSGSLPVIVNVACPPEHVQNLNDRGIWQISVSSNFPNNIFQPEYAINGDYATFWHSHSSKRPWIQVELSQVTTVGQLDIATRTDADAAGLTRFNFMEVRVGKTNIAGSSEAAMSCENQLCYRTSETLDMTKSVKCVTPLEGNIITIQKYDHKLDNMGTDVDYLSNHYLEVADIQIFAYYCKHPEGLCGNEEVNFCSLQQDGSPTLLTDKSAWLVIASTVVRGQLDSHGPHFAIDSVYDWSAASLFATESVSQYPWIQIALPTVIPIKGLVLKSQDGVCCMAQYLEVRIGNSDASQTPMGERICTNTLCHTTHNSNAGEKRFYCSSPLEGKYVTIQKYDSDDDDWRLELVEVDILKLDAVRHDDKEYWIASSSGAHNHEFAYNAINGISVQAGIMYHSELAPHPWFQVQLYDRYLVAGVDLFPRSNALAFQRFHYLEIRVGDNAVNGEPNTAVLTLNQLCRRDPSSAVQNTKKTLMCDIPPGPIMGQFITVQKWNFEPNGNNQYLEFHEIDVHFGI